MSVKTRVLTELVEPVVEAFGFELWGLQYMAHGNHSLLRIYIDSDKGVNVEDCAKVSRQLSSVLDVEDPISVKYTLEVSSPGLDRPLFGLNQYKRFAGSLVKLKLNRSIDGRKKFKAVLVNVDEQEETIEIEYEGNRVTIDFLNIDKANVVGDVAISKNKPRKKH